MSQFAGRPTQQPYNKRLRDYPGVLQCTGPLLADNTKATHRTETTGPPTVIRARRLAEEEFDHMWELGIIRPSTVP